MNKTINTVRTKAQRDSLVIGIKEMLDTLNEGNFDEKVNSLPIYSQEVVRIFCDESKSRTKLESLVIELEKYKIVSLTVSSQMTDEMIAKIHDWIVTHVGEYLLDFNYDPSLIAGAIVTNNGKFYDGSSSRLIDNLLSEKKVYEMLFTSSVNK